MIGKELHGVGFVLSPKIQNVLEDIDHINGRLMCIKFNTLPRPTYIINCHAPHSGIATKDEHLLYKQRQELYDTLKTKGIVILMGDLNVKLQAHLLAEAYIMRPFVFGLGSILIRNNSCNKMALNRQLLTNLCHQNELLIMNTTFNTKHNTLARLKKLVRKCLHHRGHRSGSKCLI